jgi:hypothetical protein
MSRFLLVGMVLTAFWGVGADALAQRDAGAKARGDMRGFWDQGSSRSARPSFYYQPAPAADGYRSFSYEPMAIAPGDEVTVNVAEANLMLGRNLVGTLEKGEKFNVTRVINGWLGAVVEKDGQTLKGWVWHRNVLPEDVAAEPSPQTAQQPPVERRSFSYEPAPVQPRFSQPVERRSGARMRDPIERRLRPGVGLWE